jgi:hypothetical protein
MTATIQKPLITLEQLRALYAKNAADLAEMVEAAKVATNAGAGGPKGKRYRGYFYHQIVAMAADRKASAEASDEALAPMLNALNGLYAKEN